MKKQAMNKLVNQRDFPMVILFLFFLFGNLNLLAQDSRMEAIKSRRIAFLTERMALTPSEAKDFWPVYNEYNKKRDDLTIAHREKWSGKEVAEMSQDEAARFAEDQIIYFEESSTIKREYHQRLKEILPIKKIALLYEAEHDFNKMLFQEARRRGREGGGSGR
ncbi:MAG: hypothetical protein V2I46_05430 [Bacteroides sp.]|jgi:hypothetical protein|nr:hypothetical protein [Bacteroides sp.]